MKVDSMEDSVDFSTKKDLMSAKLDQRRDIREDHFQKAKSGKDCIEEQVELFYKDLEPQIAELETLWSGTIGSADLDVQVEKLATLQKFVTDSGLFLPAYELKKNQDRVNSLNVKFQDIREKVQPKKKFGFRNAKKQAKKAAENVIPDVSCLSVVDGGAGDSSHIASKSDRNFSLKDKEGVTVIATGDQVTGKDVDLEMLENCRVEIRGAPSTLHMSRIKNCTVLCGPITTSVLMDDCQNSTLAISCQQLRIHRTTDSSFYLHTTSRAIIEDCRRVKFAPYNWSYPGMERDIVSAGLDHSINNWDQVGDFNWLATEKPSPNWSVIPEHERRKEWQNSL